MSYAVLVRVGTGPDILSRRTYPSLADVPLVGDWIKLPEFAGPLRVDRRVVGGSEVVLECSPERAEAAPVSIPSEAAIRMLTGEGMKRPSTAAGRLCAAAQMAAMDRPAEGDSESNPAPADLLDLLRRAREHLALHDCEYHHVTPFGLKAEIDAALANDPTRGGAM